MSRCVVDLIALTEPFRRGFGLKVEVLYAEDMGLERYLPWMFGCDLLGRVSLLTGLVRHERRHKRIK